jgi:hypothetical protein
MCLPKRKRLYATNYWQLQRHNYNDIWGFRRVIRPLHKVLNWKFFNSNICGSFGRTRYNYSLWFSAMKYVCWQVRKFMCTFEFNGSKGDLCEWIRSYDEIWIRTVNNYGSLDVFVSPRWRPLPSLVLANLILTSYCSPWVNRVLLTQLEDDRSINKVAILDVFQDGCCRNLEFRTISLFSYCALLGKRCPTDKVWTRSASKYGSNDNFGCQVGGRRYLWFRQTWNCLPSTDRI